jgi:predicted regulator of Ras-like GTPase activity (Roadblock/LC7/MglB family)
MSMDTLTAVLKTMKTRALADAAFVASGDGLILDAISDNGIPLDSIAAYAAGSVSVSERMGEDARLGTPQSVIHLYANKTLMIAPLGPALVVLVGNGRSQLGMMRVQLQSGLPDLQAALQRDLFGVSPEAAANGHAPAGENLGEMLTAAG